MSTVESYFWKAEKEQRTLDQELGREKLVAEKQELPKDRELDLEKHRLNVAFYQNIFLKLS